MKRLLLSILLFAGSSAGGAQHRGARPAACDLSYTVSIYELSAEGGEATVCIKRRAIASAACTLFGETGKAIYTFRVCGGDISVERKEFRYLKQMMDLKGDADLKLTSSKQYTVPFRRFETEKAYEDDSRVFTAIKAAASE